MKGKRVKKPKIIYIVIIIIPIYILICIMYYISKVLTPSLMAIAGAEYKSMAIETLESTVYEIYTEKYKYEDFVNFEKDSQGNITMLRADTVKMSYIAEKAALECTKRLRNKGNEGIEIPLSYASKNNFFINAGPKITVKMRPIKRVEVNYESEFESAGINQTRHKIKIKLITKMMIIIPTENKEIEVEDEIPISETIIVGQVPDANFSIGN